MLAGDFARKLKRLNPQLKIYCGDSNLHPASLYYVRNSEEITVCGVDKNEVPEFTVWDEQGHIIKSGWRRVLKILIDKKLVNRTTAENLFSIHHIYRNTLPSYKQKYKPVDQYHPDDLREIGSTL